MGYEVVIFANQALCELIDVNYQDCPEEEKPNDNKGSPDDCVGNPVSLQTLTKRVQESDFEGGGLSFTRTYNGPYKNVDRVIKGEWTNSFSLEIRANLLETNHNPEIAISSLDGYKILLYRENGNFIEFDLSAGGQPVPTYSSHDFTLERAVDYSWWKVINDKDEAELYDVNGRLTSITSSNGRVISWTYDDSNGAIVTNSESGESPCIEAMMQRYLLGWFKYRIRKAGFINMPIMMKVCCSMFHTQMIRWERQAATPLVKIIHFVNIITKILISHRH